MVSFHPLGGAEAAQCGRGRAAVALMLVLGLAAAVCGIAYQREQTRRCLAFFGPVAARRIAAAPYVELMRLAPGEADGRFAAIERRDISNARGLVHLRRGLVEDANYDWARGGGGARLPASRWNWAIAFAESKAAAEQGDATTVVFDLDGEGERGQPDGWMAVVGAPGRVGLGRIARGLTRWIGGR